MNQNIRYTIGIQCLKGKELSATPEEFKKLLNERRRIFLSKRKQEKSICEYLTPETQVKMYFDLDCNVATENEIPTARAHVKDIIKRIVEDMEQRFRTVLEYVVTVYDGVETQEAKRSKGDNYKVSRHIIFPNLVLSSVADAKRIAEHYKKMAGVVDTACYGTTQKIRCVYTPKDEHQKIHSLEDVDADIEDAIIQYNNRGVDVMTKEMIETAYPEFQIKKVEVKREEKREEPTEQTNAKLPCMRTLDKDVKKLKEYHINTNQYNTRKVWIETSWALINDFGKTNELKKIWRNYSDDYYKESRMSEEEIEKEWESLCGEAYKYPFCNYNTKIKTQLPPKKEDLGIDDIMEILDADLDENIKVELGKCIKESRYYLFKPSSGTWTSSEAEVQTYIWTVMTKHQHSIGKLRSSIMKDIHNHIHIFKEGKYIARGIKWDNQPYILPFENGVYDLRTGTFTKPTKEMYITRVIPYQYEPMSEEQIKESKLWNVLRKTFPDEAMLKLALQALATSLLGINIQKVFVWTGRGGNGKGVLGRLIKAVLSTVYCINGNVAVLCEKTKTGGNPELANLGGMRCVLFNEPDGVQKINSETLKGLTGGDDITARGLFDTNTNKANHLTLHIQSNDVPKLTKSAGDAEDRRFVFIIFESLFRKEQTTDDWERKVFPADDYVNTQEFLEECRLPLLNLLTAYAKEYIKRERFDIPEQSEALKRSYLNSCSAMTAWAEENLERVEDSRVYVSVKDIIHAFKSQNDYESIFSRNEKRTHVERVLREELRKSPYYGRDYHERKKIDGENFYNIVQFYRLKTAGNDKPLNLEEGE